VVILIWDLPDDPDGNVAHIAEHGITPEEVREAMDDPGGSGGLSRSSGRPIAFGETAAGRYLAMVYEVALDDPKTLYVVTAYDAPRRRRR
jgi:hypothetical protein